VEALRDESQAAHFDPTSKTPRVTPSSRPPVNIGTPHGKRKFVNDPVRRNLGSGWVLLPLAIAGGTLVAFGLRSLRQPAARFLLPGRIAFDVAELVTPRVQSAFTSGAGMNPDGPS
jgi:hypothetical protein